MTRRTAEVTIAKDGAEVPERRRNRDGGKTFIITEWPAMVAEKWADRALVAIGNSTAKVDYVMGSGMAGIAFLGLRSLLGVSEGPALALTDELMQCVTIKVQLAPEGRPLVENDIEEVTTIWRLKSEAFALHTGFSWAEISQMLISAGSKAEGLANTLSTSPKTIGFVISAKAATYEALTTSLGVRDLYDLIDILVVDAHNRHVMQEAQIAMGDSTVLDAFVIELGLDPSKLSSGQSAIMDGLDKLVERTRKQSTEIEKQTTDALSNIEKLGRAALGIFAAFTAGHDIRSFIQQITDVNAGLGRTARVAGTSAQTLAAWRGAVERVGGSAEALTGSVQNMIQDFEQFRVTGQSAIIPYLRALGVQIVDAKGHLRDFGAIWLDVADQFQKRFANDPARAAFFGKALGLDPGTINLLLQGRGAVQKMLDEQKKLVPSPADIKAAYEMQNAFAGLEQQSKRLGTTILTSWVPALKQLTGILKTLGDWLQAHPTTLNTIADGLLAIGSALTFGLVASGVGVAFRGLLGVFTLLSTPVMFLARTAFPLLTTSIVGLDVAIGPIVLILGAIAVLGYAGYELIAHWNWVSAQWKSIWKSMGLDVPQWASGYLGMAATAGVAAVFPGLGASLFAKQGFAAAGSGSSGTGAGGGGPSGDGGILDLMRALEGFGDSGDGGILDLMRALEGSGDSAISPKGAIGRYQIMPGTALQYGFNPAMLKDPAYNTLVAATILADLSRKYNGDLQAVEIAYNAGPGWANRWLKSGRNNSILPLETQKYLRHSRALTAATNVSQLSAGLGTSIAGGGSTTNDHSRHVTVENLTVNSRATDAAGIAGDIGKKLEQVTMTASSQGGPQ